MPEQLRPEPKDLGEADTNISHFSLPQNKNRQALILSLTVFHAVITSF